MKRRAIPKRENVSVSANRVAAFDKVGTAPIERLTPAMIDSIAASHARRGTDAFAKLLSELTDVADARRSMVRA